MPGLPDSNKNYIYFKEARPEFADSGLNRPRSKLICLGSGFPRRRLLHWKKELLSPIKCSHILIPPGPMRTPLRSCNILYPVNTRVVWFYVYHRRQQGHLCGQDYAVQLASRRCTATVPVDAVSRHEDKFADSRRREAGAQRPFFSRWSPSGPCRAGLRTGSTQSSADREQRPCRQREVRVTTCP